MITWGVTSYLLMIDFLNIFEARRNSVILVDFQPTYARYPVGLFLTQN